MSRPWSAWAARALPVMIVLFCCAGAGRAPAVDPASRDPSLLPRGTRPVSDDVLRAEAARLHRALGELERDVARLDSAEPKPTAGAAARKATPVVGTAAVPPAAVIAAAMAAAQGAGTRVTTDSPIDATALAHLAGSSSTVAPPRDVSYMSRSAVLAHNAELRGRVDGLLLRWAERAARVPARPKARGPFNPRIVDYPRGTPSVGGQTVDEVDRAALFAGEPVAQTPDGVVVYEWAWSGSNPERSLSKLQVRWVRIGPGGRAAGDQLVSNWPSIPQAPPERPTIDLPERHEQAGQAIAKRKSQDRAAQAKADRAARQARK